MTMRLTVGRYDVTDLQHDELSRQLRMVEHCKHPVWSAHYPVSDCTCCGIRDALDRLENLDSIAAGFPPPNVIGRAS